MTSEDRTTRERIGTVLFYGIVILLGYLVYRVVEPFAAPLAWAAVLVVVAHPIFDRFEAKWGATVAALVCTILVTIALIVPTLAAGYSFVKQGVSAVHAVQNGVASGHFDWVNHAWARLQEWFPSLGTDNIPDTIRDYADVVATFVAARLGWVVSHLAVFFFDLGVAILAMFYLFRDGKSVVARLQAVLPFGDEQGQRILNEAENLIFASVISTAAVALAQGVLGTIGFAVCGIAAPIFWGVMMGMFSLVPAIGSALIWVPASVSLMLTGHVTRGILLFAFCGVIVSSVDNIIRPWLISGRAEMGGLVVFISVLGGIEAFGMLGIVLGPIIVGTAASLLDLYAPGPGKKSGTRAVKAHQN